MAKPSSHAVVDSGEVPAAGGAAGDPSGFAAGEDGKWNLAEATLAAFPSRFPTLAAARKAVRRGEVAAAAADGARAPRRGDFRPSPGSRLEILQRVRSSETQVLDPYPADTPKLVVAYEDDHCAVVVKPERAATVGARARSSGPPSAWRAYATRPCVDTPGALARPRPVHRLDQGTGAARRRQDAPGGHGARPRLPKRRAAQALPRRARRAARRRVGAAGNVSVSGEDGEAGVALKTVDGAHPLSDRRVIDTPLSGKPCVTRWRVVRDAPCDTHERVTLVDMWPETGRKHQLRRHAAETLQAPILGDVRYARYAYGKEAAAKEDGLFLWAVELRVPVSAMPWLDPDPGRAERHFGEKNKGPRHDFYDDDENNRWLRVRVDDPPKFARRLERSTR